MRMLMLCVLGVLLAATAVWTGSDSGSESAWADLINGKGERIGYATFAQSRDEVRIRVVISNLPPGIHAMHIHAGMACHGPDFKSVGPHFNPYGRKHGAQNKDGPHAGDLPNFEVREDGTAQVEVTSLLVSLGRGRNSLFPSGKTCLVIHDNPDDEVTDPAGNAGARIACGVILRQ
jgi:superoxide dismutase, Cu-Zn family